MSDPLAQLQQVLAGRYRVDRTLGAGGMATVFLAHDLKHDRPVALKLLKPELAVEIGTGRFSREIRLAARLQHPHICSVYDSGESSELCWFTMPYIEGESLDVRLEREGRLPFSEALRIAREAALALAYAHGQGVIHRDIKPGNLLLTRDGTSLVADFGIARSIRKGTGTGNETLTREGFSPGTPAYMSPEQSAADHQVDGRTDIYSLAVVLFEMLTGGRPYSQGALGAAIAQNSTEPVPGLSRRPHGFPPSIDTFFQRALAFDPARRYSDMGEFGEALELLRQGRALPSEGGWLALMGGVMRSLFTRRPVSVTPVTPRDGSPSAAVLPFRDLSPGQDQVWFSDGLAEELTTALSRIAGLKVAGRSAAFRFRGPSVDVQAAGRSLGVGAVVSGSVRRSGDRLRIGAQLLNVADGFELWSESYDRDLADVFKVQDEIAQSIVAALRVRLMGTAVAPLVPGPTADLEAYDRFLQGRFAWHQRTAQTLPEAARCFEEAVARDPSFARAWAGLADACTLLPPYVGTSPAVAWPRAKAAAERAIALDPGLADAHTSLAYGTMLYEWDWARSESSFRRAIAADPTYQIAHHWYADFLAGRGRFEEALASMQRARELDPLSRITGVELAWVHYLLGHYDVADRQANDVLRLDPAYAHGHFILGMIRLQQGRAAESCDEIGKAIELGGFYAHATGALIAAQVAAGRRAEAEASLAALMRRSASEYVPPAAFAIAYGALGDLDQAFAALDRGIAERDVVLPENFFEPLFAPLRADPRYERVAALIRG